MGTWREIVLEAFCLYNCMTRKVYKAYPAKDELRSKENPLGIDKKDVQTYKNDGYIPASKRPYWCRKHNKERVPEFRCLCDGDWDKRCPFFAGCDADPKIYKQMRKIKW